ncbi:MAG: hypothetical protein ACM32E_06510 [Gemmatimonadota bacterium]
MARGPTLLRWRGSAIACTWWIRWLCTWSRPVRQQAARQADGQHRNPEPVSRPEFFTTAYFHTPEGLASEISQAGFTGAVIYGVEGPGWPLRQDWADPARREHILFAARAAETRPSLIGFSPHLIAAAAKP